MSDPWLRSQQPTFDIEEHKKVKFVQKPVNKTIVDNGKPAPGGTGVPDKQDKPVEGGQLKKL